MNDEQKKALEDMRAFISFALAENMSFYSVLGTLGHDIRGLFDEDETFLPRTSGYAKRCKACGELLEGEIRVHHHTENGVDVTA